MSAECFKHGCDLVYGDDGMASVCMLCEREDERADLCAAGDQLQSAASRLAEFVNSFPFDDVPYEVRGALFEAGTSVARWTEIRRKTSVR